MDKSKRSWQTEETRAFLLAYMARQSEFENSKKKKFAMSTVLEDLISQNVLTQPTTVELLNNKLKNLLRAYKNSKDNNKRTGQSLSVPPFEDLMDEIFGNNPIIFNTHTLSLSGEEVTALTATQMVSIEITDTSPSPISPTSAAGSSSSYGVVQKSPKRSTIKEKYFAEKIRIKENYYQNKIKEMKERRLDKQRQHTEKMEALNNLKN